MIRKYKHLYRYGVLRRKSRRGALCVMAFVLIASLVLPNIPSPPAKAVIPTSVQRFTATMSTNATVDTNLTTAVDPDHAYIVAESRSTSAVATHNKVAASFINGGAAVRLTRAGTTSGTTVQVQVVTMPSITVEHGVISTSSLGTGVSSFDQTITDVGNTNKAFAVITNFGTDNTAGNYMRQQWAAKLTTSTNLNVARSVTGSTSTVHYQIVKFIDATTIEHDTITIAAAASSGTAAISSTTLADSFLWGSWRGDTASRTDLSPTWEFSSTTQVQANRTGTTGSTVVELMTVRLPSSAVTQRHSITDIGNPTNQTVTAVADTAKTFTFVSARHNGTTAVYNQMIATTNLTSTTNVAVNVATTTGTLVGRLQTVELPTFVIPDVPSLHNDDGGSNQIAFNNIRQNSTTPTFRASATNSTNFDRFQLELNAASDFSGTSYTQTFSSTYTSGTQYNLAATSLSPSLPTTNGVTYYARVRASADSGVLWSDWSTDTWTYTYKSSGSPDWFQTTDEQFDAGTLDDTATTGSDSVEILSAVTPAHVQSKGIPNDAGGGDTMQGTFDANVTSGNTIVVAATWGNDDTGLSCADNRSNSYTTVRTEYDSTNNQSFGVCYAPVTTGGSTTVTVTFGAGGVAFRGIMISEYSGIASASPVDVHDGQGGVTSTTATDNVTSTASSTTVDGDLIYGAVIDTDGANWDDASIAAGTNFTERDEEDGIAVEDRVQTTAGSTAATFTFTTAARYNAIMVAFKAATGGGGSGTITSPVIDYDDVIGSSAWDDFAWSEDQTNGTISLQLYYNTTPASTEACDAIVPDSALSGNSSGFASGPIDISGLSTSTYNEICLRATLTDSGGSPFLQDWTVTWTPANTAPDAPTSLVQRKVNDTTISTGGWTNETTVEFTASAIDDDTSNQDLQLCIEKEPLGDSFENTEDSCGSAVTESGSAVTVTHSIGSLSNGSEYHWQARIKDGGGAYSSWVSYPTPTPNAESARDFGVDTSAPTSGIVYDGTSAGVDANFNDGSLSQLSANWGSFNFDVSGAATDPYEYSIGTTQGGTDIKGWTALTGLDTSETASSLTLQTSKIYYFNVRATDNAGNQAVVSSDGQFVLPTLSFSASPTTLTLANLNAGNSYTDSEDTTLSTTTNAFGGYVVRAWATAQLGTTGATFQIPWHGGSWSDPAAPGAGYGYTSSDTSVQGSNRFNNATEYAPFTQSTPGDIIADRTSPTSGAENFTITHRVQSSASQAAGRYSTTIVYIVTPTY